MASKYCNLSLEISSLACNTDQPIKMCVYKTHEHVERERVRGGDLEGGFGDDFPKVSNEERHCTPMF